ncbi:MAG: hypothetical protein ACI82G_000829 [Bradymonadia bacterium]|jgi:hypothetical protein
MLQRVSRKLAGRALDVTESHASQSDYDGGDATLCNSVQHRDEEPPDAAAWVSPPRTRAVLRDEGAREGVRLKPRRIVTDPAFVGRATEGQRVSVEPIARGCHRGGVAVSIGPLAEKMQSTLRRILGSAGSRLPCGGHRAPAFYFQRIVTRGADGRSKMLWR